MANDALDRAIEKFNAPPEPVEYKPMPDAYVPEPEKQKEFGSDADGLKKAAKDLEEQRAAGERPPPIERKYQFIGGEDDGKDVPLNQTLSVDRAARDLTRQRDFEANAEQQQTDEVVAAVTDATRAQVQEQLQQAQQAQPQPTPEAQPQGQQPEAQQPASQQQATDEEALRTALERPAVRQALEQQISQVEQAKADYAQKAGAAFDMSYASLLSNFPELRGVSGQQLPAVLNVLQRENPVRHAAVMSALYTTDHLHTQASRAKQAEAIVTAAKTELYGRQQDAAMDQFIAQQPAEESRAVKENIARIASQYYGVQPEQLAEAIRTNPGMRAEPFQRMLYSTVLGHLKNEALAAKRVPPKVPPVMRPGVSQPQGTADERDVASALARFNKNPNPKSAADYLNARRGVRR